MAGAWPFSFGSFFKQLAAKMHIFHYVEVAIGVEELFSCFLTLAFLVVSIYVPRGVTAIGIRPNIVRNVCQNKLTPWDIVSFVILKIIMI